MASLYMYDLNSGVNNPPLQHEKRRDDDSSLMSHIAAEEDNLFEYSRLANLNDSNSNNYHDNYYDYTTNIHDDDKMTMKEKELSEAAKLKYVIDKYSYVKLAPRTSPLPAVPCGRTTNTTFAKNRNQTMSKVKQRVEYQKLSILSKSHLDQHNAYTDAELSLNKAIERAHLALFDLADVATDSFDSANGILHSRMYQPAQDRITHANVHISPTPSPVKKKKTVDRYRAIIKTLAS
eukprot:g6038.t1